MPWYELANVLVAMPVGGSIAEGRDADRPDGIAEARLNISRARTIYNPVWRLGLAAAVPLSFVGTEADWNAAAGLSSGMALGPSAFRSPSLPQNWQVTTNSQAAFEIDGTAVPEPHYAWVVVLGCLFAGI
jgi:hypothetical protein